MSSDIKRLETLLKIAQEHEISLDDLDDQSWQLDWQTFQAWSAKFLQAQAKQSRDLHSRPPSESVRPDREFANDDRKFANDDGDGQVAEKNSSGRR